MEIMGSEKQQARGIEDLEHRKKWLDFCYIENKKRNHREKNGVKL